MNNDASPAPATEVNPDGHRIIWIEADGTERATVEIFAGPLESIHLVAGGGQMDR